jgi:hypothetical protein
VHYCASAILIGHFIFVVFVLVYQSLSLGRLSGVTGEAGLAFCLVLTNVCWLGPDPPEAKPIL